MIGSVTSAVVLAAGFGTRMRPLTDDRPKPMVALAGRPLIDHVLDGLADSGVQTAAVNVHYKAEVLTEHLANRRRPRVVVSDETGQLLDTGGGVTKAMALIDGAAFLIHNSDSVWTGGHGRNIDRLVAAFEPDRMDSIMLLAPRAACIGYDGPGDFDFEAGGRLRRRTGDETTSYAFAGVSVAARSMFEGAPDGAFSLNRLWDRALARGRLFGVVLDGVWMHVGDPAALAEAEAQMARAEVVR